jgi:hypothetical protein
MSMGNLPHPDDFTTEDFLEAIRRTHRLHPPVPPRMRKDQMDEVVILTREANRSVGRRMGYGAILAWGISIGVLAERARRWRSQRDAA